jgi:thiol-disulfide isomerase/thioredoxin
MEQYKLDFASRQEYIQFINETCKENKLVVKFTADWCGPCKSIQQYTLQKFNELTMDQSKNKGKGKNAVCKNAVCKNAVCKNAVCKNAVCVEIDVDESFDIFAHLKQKKMIQGIPTFFAYDVGSTSVIPTNCVVGANTNELDFFFRNI